MKKKYDKLSKKFEKVQEKLDEFEEKEHLKEAVSCFVTFKTEEAFVRCRKAYPNLGPIILWQQKSRMRLQGYSDW
jgi:hypothetical protein